MSLAPRRLRFAVAVVALCAPALSSAVAGPYKPTVGKAHPQIVLPTIEHDRTIALSDLRGKKVLLIHFASW